FEGDPARGSLSVIEQRDARRELSAQELLDHGDALEQTDPDAALAAYRQAVALEPKLVEAHISLGWLLHERGRFAQAERAYRAGLRACGPDASLLYNLGVLLEDMGRPADAAQAYADALGERPDFADCHYNLALLYEALKRPRDAIRHMAQYRRLVRSR